MAKLFRNIGIQAFTLTFVIAAAAAGASAPGVVYRTGTWDPESGLGNHRAVVRVESAGKAGAVRVIIPWRRPDPSPELKNLMVFDAATGARVTNVLVLAAGPESGDVVFQPATVPGDYYIYYMPYKSEGRKYYPKVKYDPPVMTADAAWLAKFGLTPGADNSAAAGRLAAAEVKAFEAADEFSSFFPMQVIATAEETARLLAAHPEPFLVFPEDRKLSIRMSDRLPLRWIENGPGGTFRAEARRGEYLSFQLGVWAARTALKNVTVAFQDLRAEGMAGVVLASGLFNCLNTGGTDWDGSPLRKTVPVERGRIQAMWCGLKVPEDAAPGVYEGRVTVRAEGLPDAPVTLRITVRDEEVKASGDDDPCAMTRLRWLDSTIAMDDDIVKPFIPLQVSGRKVTCLGRTLEFNRLGLPERITSTFTEAVTSLDGRPFEILAGPVELRAVDAAGAALKWKPAGKGAVITKRAAGQVAWEAADSAPGFEMNVGTVMEFDGYVGYRISLKALRDADLADIRLVIPFRREAARYMMGLGFKGGERPGTFGWTWDVKKNQDALWLGAVNGGVQIQLRAENYSRPLNTNFYLSKPLNLPPSWYNGGAGGVRVGQGDGPESVEFTAFSGPRKMKAGETLNFDFNMLITPFKTIDPAKQFSERYYHDLKPVDEIKAAGADVVNVHHATRINPYINYPFLRPGDMKAYVDEAHAKGLKVKIYYTIRELSNRAPELFALRSLGHEIFSPGPGGGYSWLQEHLGSDYIAAWFVPELRDAAVIDSGMSRWHNYYIEGLDWLARNVGIDGLYLDDVAFDRTTMKRVRKVLERRRPEPRIDLHSANQYNVNDGFCSSANLYMEHFPYLDRLWFGEYFDYNSPADYWLVEMSGIPFGLMGEMLQDGGNPWRGMLFGMTARLPWSGDPRPLWKAWDEFGIVGSEMISFWAGDGPVRTGNGDVHATVYLRKAGRGGAKPRAMIAVAGWNKEPVDVRLNIDWKALGLDPGKALLRAPAIDRFQDAGEFKPGDSIRIEPGKGRLLILGE